jgi:hypothetical protein
LYIYIFAYLYILILYECTFEKSSTKVHFKILHKFITICFQFCPKSTFQNLLQKYNSKSPTKIYFKIFKKVHFKNLPTMRFLLVIRSLVIVMNLSKKRHIWLEWVTLINTRCLGMTNSSKLYITKCSQNRRSVKVCPNPSPKTVLGTRQREHRRPSHIGRSDLVKMTHTATGKGISHILVFLLRTVIKPSHKNVVSL